MLMRDSQYVGVHSDDCTESNNINNNINNNDNNNNNVLIASTSVASTIKELVGKEVVEFVTSTVTQYTLVAISKQAGPKAVSTEIIKNSLKTALDPHTLVDAILDVMGSDDRELCPAGLSALSTSVRVAVTVLGTVDRVFSLPFFEYFSDKALELCYERSWYNKMGG